MRSTIFWVSFSLCYIAFISWNIHKLRDIRHNPANYKMVKGAELYQKSSWFEVPNKQHRKHYWASLIVCIPLFLAFSVISFCVPSMVQKILFISSDFVLLQSPGVLISTIGALFLSMALEPFILFSINRPPIFVAARLYLAGCTFKSDSDDYLKAWKKTFLLLLVMGMICLPMMAIGINAYSYADEEKIVTHGVFSLQEREILYASVVSGETCYTYDEKEDAFSFEYHIILADGSEMELVDFGVNGAIYIDSHLRQYGIQIHYGVMDAETYQHVKKICDLKTIQFVEQCFSII